MHAGARTGGGEVGRFGLGLRRADVVGQRPDRGRAVHGERQRVVAHVAQGHEILQALVHGFVIQVGHQGEDGRRRDQQLGTIGARLAHDIGRELPARPRLVLYDETAGSLGHQPGEQTRDGIGRAPGGKIHREPGGAVGLRPRQRRQREGGRHGGGWVAPERLGMAWKEAPMNVDSRGWRPLLILAVMACVPIAPRVRGFMAPCLAR